ncbi:MAG: hypothetical protein AB7G87_01150 [Clostridia bacterium]
MGGGFIINNKKLEFYWDEGFRYVRVLIDNEVSIMSIIVANEVILYYGADIILGVDDFGYVGEAGF